MGVETCFTEHPDGVYLMINSDDFGLCHAVNEAMIQGYRDGIITSGSLMVPAPWAPEAIRFLKNNPHYAVGIHVTLTNSFDNIRVGPIMPLDKVPSLVNAQGCFHETVEAMNAHADPEHIKLEVRAQIERAFECGLTPSHLDNHMRSLSGNKAADPRFWPILYDAAEHYRLPILNYANHGHRLDIFDQALCSSDIEKDRKLDAVIQELKALRPGLHYYLCHLGVPSEELENLSSSYRPWSQDYRVSDDEVWRHPKVRRVLKDLQINLTHMGQVRTVYTLSE